MTSTVSSHSPRDYVAQVLIRAEIEDAKQSTQEVLGAAQAADHHAVRLSDVGQQILQHLQAAVPLPRNRLEPKPTPSLEHNPLVQRKLANPSLPLSPEESLTLLTTCIQYGQAQAQKAQAQDLLIFIGNTGSGKSTLANYLAGCTLTKKSPKELGITALGKVIVVVPKAQGGTLDEIMPIGHTKESKTFIPQIEKSPSQPLTYCDCPGFLDNRGAEINIANAVNIKNALLQAQTVRVVILINYHSLKADRGRGLSEMLQITTNLFGNSQNLLQHKDSLLVGITQAPLDMSLSDLREWIADSQLPSMKTLADRLFISDPLDSPLEGGWSRSTLLEHIQTLTPIPDPRKIFSTVLTDSDETTLIRLSENLQQTIQSHLRAQAFQEASRNLERFQELSVIDHVAVERLLHQTQILIDQHIQELAAQFKSACHFEEFDKAKTQLLQIQGAQKHFPPKHKDIALEQLQAYYDSSYERMEKAQEKEKAYQEQLRQANRRIEEFIQLLEEQKRSTEEKLKEQQEAFRKLQAEMQKSFEENQKSYESFKEQLLQEMKLRLKHKEEELQLTAQGDQEAQEKIQQETKRLEAEYEQRLQKAEEEKQALVAKHEAEKAKQQQRLAQEKEELETRLKTLEAQKQEQIQAIQSIQGLQPAAKLPDIAFGKDLWARYFGDIGVEPPLPPNIEEILSSPCPIWGGGFFNRKKVRETHMLVLIPETVNGEPLTLKTLGKLVQKPLQGQATKYISFYLGQYQDRATPKSHWALLTSDVLPGSRSKSHPDQQAQVTTVREKTNLPYEIPTILDATVCILMEYFRTGKRLYSDEPLTYTRCQEKYDKDWQLVVGSFAPGGLVISSHDWVIVSGFYGVGVLRKF